MSSSRAIFVRTYAAFAGVAFATAGIVAAGGCAVVTRLAVSTGIESVLIGCGISWVASCAGAIPIALTVAARSNQAVNSVLASTAIRFTVVLILVAPLLLSGWFDRKALVMSLAASYLLTLLVDSMFAVRALRRPSESESG